MWGDEFKGRRERPWFGCFGRLAAGPIFNEVGSAVSFWIGKNFRGGLSLWLFYKRNGQLCCRGPGLERGIKSARRKSAGLLPAERSERCYF